MDIRTAKSSDYAVIQPLINEWWGGRALSDKLPKLFFDHFQPTSFIAEKNGELVGFLVGFLSQTFADQAYIHFIGVHPAHRQLSVGKQLYATFFQAAQQHGRETVRCITSPVNKASIAYHTKMGFEIERGDKEVDEVSVHADYDGPGQDMVLFVKRLSGSAGK